MTRIAHAALLAIALCSAMTVAAADKVLTTMAMPGSPGSELSIVMRSGRAVNDTDAWCGAGKYLEGEFHVRVRRRGGPAVETPLAPLFEATAQEPMRLPAGRWTLVVRDYSGNGRPEFTRGQYANCNGWRYRVLSVGPDGRVTRLALHGRDELFIASRAPSVALPVKAGAFTQRYHDNTRGVSVEQRWRWNAAQDRFEPEIAKDPP
jgi:hypothetical protein